MNDHPPKVSGEHFSETVLIYDGENDYQDLGFYDYESKEWKILGDLQMKMTCWIWIPELEEINKKYFHGKEIISSLERVILKPPMKNFSEEFTHGILNADPMSRNAVQCILQGKNIYEVLELVLKDRLRLVEINTTLMQYMDVGYWNHAKTEIDKINKKFNK